MEREPEREADTGTQEETRPRENIALCQKGKKADGIWLPHA